MRTLAAYWVWCWMDVNYPGKWNPTYPQPMTMTLAGLLWTLILLLCVVLDFLELKRRLNQ